MKLLLEVPLDGKTHKIELTRSSEPVDGKTTWTASCRLPCTGHFGMSFRKKGRATTADSPVDGIGDEGDAGFAVSDNVPTVGRSGEVLIEGIASSTSIDWHGTEMSIEALHSMAAQFKAGVPYVPSHRDDEWDQVFGRTVDAEVVSEAVLNDYNSRGVGEGSVVRVTTALIGDDTNTKRLIRMLGYGHAVGMSIGGWFTDMEVTTNDEDEVERMIIKDVELDHLATTRRPSNPDTWIQEMSRSIKVARSTNDKEEMVQTRSVLDAPGYRFSDDDRRKCATCKHLGPQNFCSLYTFGEPDDGYVCDSHAMKDSEDYVNQEPVVEPLSKGTPPQTRAASDYKNLAIAPPDAEYNPKEQDDAEIGDNILGTLNRGEADWERYRAAHLWWDEDKAEEKEGYRFPIGRMYDPDDPDDALAEDGTLHVFLDKIQMVSQELADGAEGVSDDDLADMLPNLQKYFDKFEVEPELAAVDDEDDEDDDVEVDVEVDEKGGGKKKKVYFSSDAPTEARAVVPFGDLKIHQPEDAPWSFQTDEQNELLGDPPDWDKFKKAHTWWDPDRPDQREGYKLPIGKLVDGRVEAFWRGIVAAMAVINGARGGAKISEDDRKGIYNVLSRYYKKAGKEPPIYKSIPETESNESGALDTEHVTGEQSTYGDDAHRSAPGSNPVNTNPNESKGSAMSDVQTNEANVPDTTSTEETLKSLTRSMGAMENILAKMVDRDLARSENNTPEPETESPSEPEPSEAEMALRHKVEALENRITRMAAQRVGTAAGGRFANHVEPHKYNSLSRAIREECGDGSALALISEHQESRRAAEIPQTPTRRSLENDLHSLLTAAIADGVITDPEYNNGWR
jgi:hypothetical protein